MFYYWILSLLSETNPAFAENYHLIGERANGNYIWGITTDRDNNLYIVHSDIKATHVLAKYNRNGELVQSWGTIGNLQENFRAPAAVAVDSKGSVYITDIDSINFGKDSQLPRVLKFTNDGKFITSWGSKGTNNGQFLWPSGIAIDSADNIYVADSYVGKVEKFTNDGKFITSWGSKGTNNFLAAWDIAVNSKDEIYVTDRNSSLPSVQKFTNNGKFITSWGSKGTNNGQFDDIFNISVDPSNNVYVTDNSYGTKLVSRLQEFDPNGEFVDTIDVGRPASIAFDSSGTLYVNNSYGVDAYSSMEVPPAPLKLSARAVSSTQVNLSWTAPSTDSSHPISEYKIEYKEGSQSYTLLQTVTITSYQHTGLKPNTTYSYRVYAINAIGASQPSTEVTVQTPSILILQVTATPTAGTYVSSQSIALSSSKPATIYYTIDGTEPTLSSTVYASPIPISATTTLKFVAIDAEGNKSQVITELYTISAPQDLPIAVPIVSLPSAESGTLVTLDGSASHYPNQDPDPAFAYNWVQDRADGSPPVLLSSTTSAKPTFTVPDVSTNTNLQFQLTVSDISGSKQSMPKTVAFIALPHHVGPDLWAIIGVVAAVASAAAGFLALRSNQSRKATLIKNTQRSHGVDPAQVLVPYGDRYDVIRQIGKGSFGVVYLATARNNPVAPPLALKVAKIDSSSDKEEVAKGIMNEAQVWSSLNSPSIVKVYACGLQSEPWIAMEYMKGGDLKNMIRTRQRIDVNTSIDITLKLLDGLIEAQAKGIVHRDVKPANILFDDKMQPKLADWGLGKVLYAADTHSTTTGTFKGTPAYAAPEQFDSDKYGKPDTRTDIYQLGVVLYEMITGKVPFEGTYSEVMYKVLNYEPAPVSSFVTGIREIDPIISKALAKRKEDRYTYAYEMKRDLARFLK